MTRFAAPIAEQIWDMKYRFKDADGTPIDKTVEDSWRRIARALAAKPRLIICDEVTSALDPLVADGILKLLLDLQAQEGVAYMFITHDLATVKAIADQIAVMHRGKVVRYGPKSQVLAPPFDDYTDLLLASVPEMKVGWLENVVASRKIESAGS